MLRKNGGMPGAEFAHSASRCSAIDSIVHGLSDSTCEIGRHPCTIWAIPPWIFST